MKAFPAQLFFHKKQLSFTLCIFFLKQKAGTSFFAVWQAAGSTVSCPKHRRGRGKVCTHSMSTKEISYYQTARFSSDCSLNLSRCPTCLTEAQLTQCIKETSVFLSPLCIYMNWITKVRIGRQQVINNAGKSAFFFQRKAQHGCVKHTINSMNLIVQHINTKFISFIPAVEQFIKECK